MKTPAQIVNSPQEFASVFLRILNKDKALVPLKWNRAQAHFHQSRTGRDLVLKARQLGFSTYVQGEMFRRAVTSTRSTITLAHDDPTTGLMRRMADRYYDNCKFGDIQPTRKYANAGLATYPEFNSEAIIAKAGSHNVGRGATLTDFHGSEVAFWPDAEKIISGAMQGGNPDVILESTPNGAQGYFYERCMDAYRKTGVWTLHFYPWWWDASYKIELADGEEIIYSPEESELVKKHPELTPAQIKWRRNKQSELKHLFIQEYPEDPLTCFLTSGNSFFGNINHVFTAPMGAVYDPSHKYRGGLDFGQTNDFVAMPIIDSTANIQVDLLHINKLEWAEMRKRVVEKYRYWHLTTLTAEKNSIGAVNIEALRRDGCKNIMEFETNNTTKWDAASALYDALHTGGLRLQDWPIQRHELNTFVATQLPSGLWRLAAEGDGHDDTVMGLILANRNVPIQVFF